ncbi:kinesin light chain 1 [Polychaeton citri CBS 116435]|uniref:Kinesin light chain 1 n=1 Tax=Polychaeton citri CBS 116435 TaxID=1314669 RepID=A0A9P4Q6F1_9PEZI|nr:kinesin light chain 1 [Polychaeton citri CBS 116435]
MRLLERDSVGNVSLTKDLPDSELPAYKYAILSHTWGPDEEEVNFHDITNGSGTSKLGYKKIQFCIQQTKQDGLKYFWVDTCCIDKDRETELSKALRSMFRWYANAEKCYVFLSDVPQKTSEQDFRSSRWFKRGWTLQELIAPSTLEFFSEDWYSLGLKESLERQISEITRIPVKALRGHALTDFTVQERRQWQVGRDTREPEDLVYSLLGLLEISMPVLYGEGKVKAWERLENEINAIQKGYLSEAIEARPFIARERELREVHAELNDGGARRTVVLQGLGGIGKTQLAIAYAVRHKEDYSAFLWVNAKDEDTLKSSYVQVVKRIIREHPTMIRLANVDTHANLDEVVDEVKAWLSLPKNSRWLMVFDNYDNPKVSEYNDPTAFDLRQYLPETYQGSVIITTRSAKIKHGHILQVNKLENLQDSLEMLRTSSGGTLTNDPNALQLVEKLDGLPLALATAGAYLRQTPMTCQQYLRHLEKSRAKLQKLSPDLTTYEDRTLYSTWQVSFEQIERKSSLSANLLRLWAYFDNQDIWFELLKNASSERPQWLQDLTEDELDFHNTLRVLCDHGLVQADSAREVGHESKGYSIHTCVHSWVEGVLNAGWNQELARTALDCVASSVPDKSQALWSLTQRRLLNHANRISRYAREFDSEVHTRQVR